MMDTTINKRKNIIIVVAAVVLVLVVVGVVLALVGGLFGQKSGFKISNEEQYLKNIRQEDKDALLSVLANHVKNVSDIDVEKTLVEGSIRDGSYSEDRQGDVVISNFLLDIDAIQQTYLVEFPWSKSTDVPDGISVECPRNDQSKFPDSYCMGIYTTSATIEIYLPYKGNVDGNEYEKHFIVKILK